MRGGKGTERTGGGGEGKGGEGRDGKGGGGEGKEQFIPECSLAVGATAYKQTTTLQKISEGTWQSDSFGLQFTEVHLIRVRVLVV